MDLLQATGAAETLTLDGEPFPVRPLKLKEWAELQAFLVKSYPSPLARAAKAIQDRKAAGEEITVDTEEMLLDHAQREELNWPPRVGSKGWWFAIDHADGGTVELIRVALSKTIPGFDRVKAEALYSRLSPLELGQLVRFALFGERPAAIERPKEEPANAGD